MSRVYVLEPHNDDAALFCSFTALREQATVITVLRSFVQERRGDKITADQRTQESRDAIEGILGLRYRQWPVRDDAPDWGVVAGMIRDLDPDRVYVPAWEDGGHEHHNALASTSATAVIRGEVVPYLTYTKAGKSTWGTPVAYEPGWVALKLRALLCFRSQVAHPLQAEHFIRSQLEYLAL